MSAQRTPGRVGFDEAVEAIVAGQAEAGALWLLLSSEGDRDGYWLRPMPWEGSGEYQRVSYKDGRNGLVRVPGIGTSLNEAAERRRRAIAKATGSASS